MLPCHVQSGPSSPMKISLLGQGVWRQMTSFPGSQRKTKPFDSIGLTVLEFLMCTIREGDGISASTAEKENALNTPCVQVFTKYLNQYFYNYSQSISPLKVPCKSGPRPYLYACAFSHWGRQRHLRKSERKINCGFNHNCTKSSKEKNGFNEVRVGFCKEETIELKS